ncbi:hypothetical protein [Streptomyces sp. NPDC049916]|uniref:hypothetical protein n=1 Tax=Streptomyces sp. NPDC049916 TaxID=3155156 RepID=UPI00344160F9
MGVAEGGGDDGALLVLTAMMLTPARFPSVLGDDYVAACEALALAPCEEGYGLVLGQDSAGARWTVVVEDVSRVAAAVAAWDCGMRYDLSPDGDSVVSALPGWPLDLAVAAPGVPEPHDPETGDEGPAPLAPPRAGAWGAAHRRLGADEVAAQWSLWRERVEESEGAADDAPGETADSVETAGAAGPDTSAETADEVPGGPLAAPDPDAAAGGGSPVVRHLGIRRVLSEALAYTRTPPPPGRIRSSFASADVRTLRVDGPGWSMVARSDDIALVLLDEEPGEVLTVRRGPALPALLRALEELALPPA